jgi:chromosome partitioning protein
MTRVIAVANHKGGVGKTTTTFNLAGLYAGEGKRVLACDLDPQASLTKLFGFKPESLNLTIADLLLRTDVGAAVIQRTSIPGISLIPSNAALASAEKQLIPRMNRERVLGRALQPLLAEFDYVLLDCPPALDLLNTNGLAAADEVLVPLESSSIALQALPEFLKTVEDIQREVNPGLHVGRIFITKPQRNTGHSQEVLRAVLAQFPGKVSQVLIPLSVLAKDSAAARKPIFSYDPKSAVAEAYRSLANEIMSTHEPNEQEITTHA